MEAFHKALFLNHYIKIFPYHPITEKIEYYKTIIDTLCVTEQILQLEEPLPEQRDNKGKPIFNGLAYEIKKLAEIGGYLNEIQHYFCPHLYNQVYSLPSHLMHPYFHLFTNALGTEDNGTFTQDFFACYDDFTLLNQLVQRIKLFSKSKYLQAARYKADYKAKKNHQSLNTAIKKIRRHYPNAYFIKLTLYKLRPQYSQHTIYKEVIEKLFKNTNNPALFYAWKLFYTPDHGYYAQFILAFDSKQSFIDASSCIPSYHKQPSLALPYNFDLTNVITEVATDKSGIKTNDKILTQWVKEMTLLDSYLSLYFADQSIRTYDRMRLKLPAKKFEKHISQIAITPEHKKLIRWALGQSVTFYDPKHADFQPCEKVLVSGKDQSNRTIQNTFSEVLTMIMDIMLAISSTEKELFPIVDRFLKKESFKLYPYRTKLGMRIYLLACNYDFTQLNEIAKYYTLHPLISAFLVCLQKHLPSPHKISKLVIASKLSNFSAVLKHHMLAKQYIASPLYKKSIARYQQTLDYFNKLLEQHSQLSLFRLELSYLTAASNDQGIILPSHYADLENIKDVQQHRVDYMNSLRKELSPKQWVGYVWKLKYTPHKGFYYEWLLALNYPTDQQPIIQRKLTRTWQAITQQSSSCQLLYQQYAKSNHKKTAATQTFIQNTLAILFMGDVYLSFTPDNVKVFDCGQLSRQ